MRSILRTAVLWLLFALSAMGIAAGCAPTALHPCAAEGCTKEGTHLHLDENGAGQYYCEVHYREIVPPEETASAAQAVQRDPALCEVCDETGTLTFTDEDGTEHLYCSVHYTEAVQQNAEDAAQGTVRGCDICGKKAVLSTKTADGTEHFYCYDHYSEMLDLLG